MYPKIPKKIKYIYDLYMEYFFAPNKYQNTIKILKAQVTEEKKDLLEENQKLRIRHEKLREKYDNLEDKYNNLKQNSITTTSRNSGSISIYKDSVWKDKYFKLNEDYETLKKIYIHLVDELNDAKKKSKRNLVQLETSMLPKEPRSMTLLKSLQNKGGKSKKNKLRRGKYRITKRKY
jgi:regulator of replication initiation timing